MKIYSGAKGTQVEYWQQFLKYTSVLPLDANAIAVNINNDLKRTSNPIDIADLFIAAIAIQNNLPIATLNKRHFERIQGLLLVNLF
jgi:predicted nucleic acid-binding protein